MKLSIYGVTCPDCKGERYRVVGRLEGHLLKPKKELCETCQGEGVIRASSDKREGIEWERE